MSLTPNYDTITRRQLHHVTPVSPGVIHNSVESVCDGEDGAVFKLTPDRGLDEVIRLQVNSSCSFIQDEDPGLPQQSSSQTHQLPLTHTEEDPGTPGQMGSRHEVINHYTWL